MCFRSDKNKSDPAAEGEDGDGQVVGPDGQPQTRGPNKKLQLAQAQVDEVTLLNHPAPSWKGQILYRESNAQSDHCYSG